MIDVSFDDYSYYPAIRTRVAELRGLQELDPSRKAKILPVLTLGRWPKAADFSRSATKADEAMSGHPYILDLTTDASHLAVEQLALRNHENAFQAWRTFCQRYERAVPVVQFGTEVAKRRDTTKQAQEIERSIGKLAFRIVEFGEQTPLVINALSALDDPRNAIVFIDCGYIRNALAAYTTACIATINQLRTEFPEIQIAVLSTSFPPSTAPFADASGLRGSIDILERQLHQKIGGDAVATYGDHGSVHSVVYDEQTIMRWAARIDYPTEIEWYFERRPQNQSEQGYISAAEAIAGLDPELGTRNIWGEAMIEQAAAGKPHGKAPSSWIAVRVNIHLSRQIDFSEHLEDEFGESDVE